MGPCGDNHPANAASPEKTQPCGVVSLCLLRLFAQRPADCGCQLSVRADCVVVPFGMQSMLRSLGVPPMASLDPLAKALLISTETLAVLLVLFLLLACFGRSVGRQSEKKWQASASLWPSALPAPLVLERSHLVNQAGLKLRRFTIRAPKPTGACILLHGYGQSAHFEFLCADQPGGPHSTWNDSILAHLVAAGISVYAIDLQGHGESEGARGLRGFFEKFDDLAGDALLLHEEVQRETGGGLPIFWLGTSMGGAVAARAAQMRPRCMSGLVMIAPMISLEKVAEKSVFGPIRNRHLKPVAGFLSWLLPALPLIKKSDSVLAQQLDDEFRADVTNYTGSVRVRVAYHFDLACREFLRKGGPQALERIECPALLALHANADTMTEPHGSISLFERASCDRKTLVLISGPDGEPGLCRTSVDGVVSDGLSTGGGRSTRRSGKAAMALSELQGLNMWHSITTEPGCEKVSIAVAAWVAEEAGRAATRP